MRKAVRLFCRLIAYLIFMAAAQSCCIHLWPDPEAEETDATLVLHLKFNPDFYIWEHTYDAETGTLQESHPSQAIHQDHPGTTDVYDNTLAVGEMRHIVRIYPAGEPVNHIKEIVYTNVNGGRYDCDIPLVLEPGSYDVVVWSDLAENSGDDHIYDHNDFLSINLAADHVANSDFRDGFRGKLHIDIQASEDYEATVGMYRPMAKYEFIATGLQDFIERETTRTDGSRADLSSYRVVFTYPNFLPCSYNAVDDRIIDSRSGVSFESKMTQVGSDEVSFGFDYVMINSVAQAARSSQGVSVMVAVYDPDGEQVAQSVPITVPLRRDDHTVIRSAFLSVNSKGGVAIDPNYEGDFNVWM